MLVRDHNTVELAQAAYRFEPLSRPDGEFTMEVSEKVHILKYEFAGYSAFREEAAFAELHFATWPEQQLTATSGNSCSIEGRH